ncbi:MAG: hypothetical protein JOY58_10890, partial [Solirubrobacterales bacterium]|nr:hypothetical protein [Solirubrobacterales bacterium]
GLAAELGTVNVEFAGVLSAEEIAAQAAASAREQALTPPAPALPVAPAPAAELPPASPVTHDRERLS